MACVLKGSQSFTCTPRIHLLTKWTIPAFAFPAEAGTHLPTPEGSKAELAKGYSYSYNWQYNKSCGFTWCILIDVLFQFKTDACPCCHRLADEKITGDCNEHTPMSTGSIISGQAMGGLRGHGRGVGCKVPPPASKPTCRILQNQQHSPELKAAEEVTRIC